MKRLRIEERWEGVREEKLLNRVCMKPREREVKSERESERGNRGVEDPVIIDVTIDVNIGGGGVCNSRKNQ